jgi:Leucine-rich repeat (LRR) protein
METKRCEFFKNDVVVYEYLDDMDEVKKLVDRAEISLELFDKIHRIRMNFELNKIEFHENMENSITIDHLIKLHDNSNDKKILSLNNQRIITLNNLIYPLNNKLQYENLISIDFSFNFIKNIYKKAFYGLKNLEYLNLSNNLIEYIHIDAFLSIEKLKHLNLSYNQIKLIEKQHFIGSNNLKEVDLSYNNLITIHFYFKNELNHLNVKSCTKNDSPIINKNLNKECLEKYCNRLLNTSIYKYLESIDSSKITLIFLDNNEIEIIQNNIFNGLNNVTLIDLQYNKITKINKETFHGLKKLNSLNLQHNKITEMDKDCFNELVSLTELYLNSNELSNIDENTFQDLFNLEKIYLQNNKFTSKLKLYLEKNLVHITVENQENNDLLNIINRVYLLLI